MIFIIDDTFIDRHKYQDVDYLKEAIYSNICTVYTIVKTIDLASLVKQLSNCQFFCNHKTLQLYNIEMKALTVDDNTKSRESLLNIVTQLNIPRVEFSRGLETNFEAKKIDKDLFYANLRAFLNYYIENNKIESKILFWGAEFEERERLTIIQKMLMQIRTTSIEDFSNDKIILKGLKAIFPNQSSLSIIEMWKNNQFSKNDIIREINNQIT